MTKTFLLKGLDCPHCSVGIEKEVGQLDGVSSSVLNLMKQTLVVEIEPSLEDSIGWLVSKTVHRYEPKVEVSELGGGSVRIYALKGMDCPDCAAKIEREVSALDYVTSAQINLMKPSLTVEYRNVSEAFLYEMVCDIVRSHEPGAEVFEQEAARSTAADSGAPDRQSRNMIIRLIVGAAIYAAGLILPSAAGIPAVAGLALLVAAYAILGADVIVSALRNIVRGRVFDENFLMTVSTVGAFVIGEYPEAVAVMLFYQVGEFFQSMAVRRSRRSIAELMDIRPDSAAVRRNGELTVVPPEAVSVGEIIVVKPGEKIPLDGIVVEGESMLDTKALTGESVPRAVRTGDEALSGCINQSGVLAVRVTKPFGESTVSKIIDMVENASSRKAPTENFITTFARYYTPVVVILAVLLAVVPPLALGGEWSEWLRRGCVFLVISCPCALVISIPLTFFGGIGAASRHGVLVKGSNYLEALNKVNTVVFDKTGTLTKGVFEVTEIIPAQGFSSEKVLEYAAKVESFSNHPIARSIISAYGGSVENSTVYDYQDIAGYGVSACVGKRKVLAGSGRLMSARGVAYTPCDAVGTKVCVAVDGQYAGCIVIADEIKPDSKAAIAALKHAGVQKTVMLTGDNEQIAADVARRLGIDEYRAQLLPNQKVDALEQLAESNGTGGKVAFVGDGINDAPVLARADVGIAMGGLGSDAAIEAADVVLMTDEPSRLVEAIDVARHTKRIVVQNIIIALGIKGLFLILGAFGIAGMWEAVFSDVGVALIAVLNAMRIIRK